MAHVEKRTHTAKNGRKSLYWRARYEDPSGKLVSKTFERKIDAERFLVPIEADVMRGEYVDPRLGTVTLADWSDQWMRTTVHLKPKTRVGYESLLRKWVLPSFGGVKLANLQPVHVRQWISDMTGQGLSPSRVRQAYRLLSAMLGSAVESGYLAKTPCIGVKLPRLPKTDIVILRPEQVDVLAKSVADSYQVLIYLLAYGGLRWGEAAALRRGRCDLLRSRIEVAESLAEVNGVHHFGTTKTHERRHVRLPAFLVEMLAQHLAELPADPDGLVFTAARGGALRYPNFRRNVWDPAVDRTGLPEGLTPHWLRHTCASVLIARGADPVAVQRHLGHKDVSTTLNLYGHLFPDRMEQLAAALEEVYQEAQANGTPPTDPQRVVPLSKPRGRKAG